MDLIRDEINSIMREMEFPTLDEEQTSVDQKWANFAAALAEQRKRHGPPEARQATIALRGRGCTGPFGYADFMPNSGGAVGESALAWPYVARDEIAGRAIARGLAQAAERAEVESLGL